MHFKQLSPLKQRLIVSSAVVAVVFLTIYFSNQPGFTPVVAAVVSVAIGLAQKEYYKLAKLKGLDPHQKTGITLSVIYVLILSFTARSSLAAILPLFFLPFSLIAIFIRSCFRGHDPLINIAVTMFGILYLSIPLGSLIQINNCFSKDSLQDGRWWLFYLLALTYITDSAAYFFGKMFGSIKFAPKISPKKTWEGAVGGFVAALLISLGFALLANNGQIPLRISYTQSALLGALVSILAQLGDLAESLIKRDAGLKDSSNIPGLGGALDVIDSLIFAAPLVYFYLMVQAA